MAVNQRSEKKTINAKRFAGWMSTGLAPFAGKVAP
jgi:hypothetical protein